MRAVIHLVALMMVSACSTVLPMELEDQDTNEVVPAPVGPPMTLCCPGRHLCGDPAEDKVRLTSELESQISKALLRFPDVREVATALQLPDSEDLTSPRPPRSPTATVVIRLRTRLHTPRLTADRVKSLVATIWPPLRSENVAVLMKASPSP